MISINEQFTQIYDDCYRMVYRYFFYKTGGKELSEDLTAETFLKAYTNFSHFDDKKASVQTWLMTLAKNIYIDNFRKHKNQIYVSDELLTETPDTTDFEKEILSADTYKILYKAMSYLGDNEKNLIALKYSAELKNKEIAVIIGKSERHTAVMLGRIITKLKKTLIKMGVDSYE